MAVTVIDRLEVIEIDEDERRFACRMPLVIVKGAMELSHERAVREQTGQSIVLHQVPNEAGALDAHRRGGQEQAWQDAVGEPVVRAGANAAQAHLAAAVSAHDDHRNRRHALLLAHPSCQVAGSICEVRRQQHEIGPERGQFRIEPPRLAADAQVVPGRAEN